MNDQQIDDAVATAVVNHWVTSTEAHLTAVQTVGLTQDIAALLRRVRAAEQERCEVLLAAERKRVTEQLDHDCVKHWDSMRDSRDKAQQDLYDLQHAVWHALDDSEDRCEADWVCVGRKDIDALSKLVPEDHPAARRDGE